MSFNDNFKRILSLSISTITAEFCCSSITRIPLLQYLHFYVMWKIQSPLFTLIPFRLSWDTSFSGFTKAAFRILKLNSTLPNPLLCTGYTSYNKHFLHSASVCVHLVPLPIYFRPQRQNSQRSRHPQPLNSHPISWNQFLVPLFGWLRWSQCLESGPRFRIRNSVNKLVGRGWGISE